MLPVVEPEGRITSRQIVLFAVMLFPVSLAPFFLGIGGQVYFLSVRSLLGLWFLWESIQHGSCCERTKMRRLLLVSVIYLPLLFVLMVADISVKI